MGYNIIATAVFKRELKRLAKKFHSLRNEYAALIETLEQDPLQETTVIKSDYLSSRRVKGNLAEPESLPIL